MAKELGKHGFDGSCIPREGCGNFYGQNTFSVGCFEWLQAAGNRLKRSRVKVRVYGYVEQPEAVYVKAREICDLLDQGKYEGPKNVKVV